MRQVERFNKSNNTNIDPGIAIGFIGDSDRSFLSHNEIMRLQDALRNMIYRNPK